MKFSIKYRYTHEGQEHEGIYYTPDREEVRAFIKRMNMTYDYAVKFKVGLVE